MGLSRRARGSPHGWAPVTVRHQLTGNETAGQGGAQRARIPYYKGRPFLGPGGSGRRNSARAEQACRARQSGRGDQPDMKALGVLLGISMAAGFAPHAGAAGCQYDMQCKGERICENSQCVSAGAPDRNVEQAIRAPMAPMAPKSAPKSEQPTRVSPATGNVPAPAPPPKAAQVTKNVPAPAQPAPAVMGSPAVAVSPAPSTEFRFCCTKVGKFPLDPEASAEGSLKQGDTCHGITSYGTPLPGTPCN
ncbi:hypothetical protein D3C81_730120 [compost metagenome]